MTIYIKGEEILNTPVECVFFEYAGGRCDSLQMTFKGLEGLEGLEIKKGDEVSAVNKNISTGTMYISDIHYCGDLLAIRALSLPLSAFVQTNRYWESVSFTELVYDISAELGLELKMLDVVNEYYVDVMRIEENPINFLQKRLMLEGFQCKVSDGRLFVFDERVQERKETELMLRSEDFDYPPEYSTSDSGLIGQITNRYEKAGESINTIVTANNNGKIKNINMAVSSYGESERFSRGILREANKNEFICSGRISDKGFKTGQTVYIADAPHGHTGINYIYMIKNNFINGMQTLYMRKPLKD